MLYDAEKNKIFPASNIEDKVTALRVIVEIVALEERNTLYSGGSKEEAEKIISCIQEVTPIVTELRIEEENRLAQKGGYADISTLWRKHIVKRKQDEAIQQASDICSGKDHDNDDEK